MSSAAFQHPSTIDPLLQPSDAENLAMAELYAEGDWGLYRLRRNQIDHADKDIVMSLKRQRALALAYLGKRAQCAGGVFNSVSPTVLTPAVVEQLGTDNTSRRHARYPWLAQLLAIAAELDREQHAHASLGARVLSFPGNRPR
ncbi:MAG: hypothetical protein M3N23_05280 [Pseudomonadota bacterium]|nr:hypothetical protein [Pseudomonadota bacterium]